MSIAVIIQFAALAVIVAIGVCIVYVIFEMREVYAEQRSKFVRAIGAVDEFQKLQGEFVTVLQRVESDGHALQKIALQIEVLVAALKNSISSSVSGAAERQTAASARIPSFDSPFSKIGFRPTPWRFSIAPDAAGRTQTI